MTVTTEIRKAIGTGNGSLTVFTHSFYVGDASEVTVYLYDSTLDTATLINASLYTLAGVATNSGSITYPLSGSPITSNFKIITFRNLPYTQTLDLNNQNSLLLENIETQLDKMVYQIQQLQDKPDSPIVPKPGFMAEFDANGNLVNGLETSVIATGITGPAGPAGPTGPAGAGDMLRADNLANLADFSAARTNLGLGALAVLGTVGLAQIDAAAKTESFLIAISNETTEITTGTAKATFRMPYAFTITGVRASLTTASSSGIPTFDINDGGTTILSTKLTIDANEKTSTTATTAAVISDTALADDAEITIDVDVAGTGAAGAKITIIGYQT